MLPKSPKWLPRQIPETLRPQVIVYVHTGDGLIQTCRNSVNMTFGELGQSHIDRCVFIEPDGLPTTVWDRHCFTAGQSYKMRSIKLNIGEEYLLW